MPAKLGRKGVEGIEQYELSPEEQAALDKSVAAVKELCDAVDRLL